MNETDRREFLKGTAWMGLVAAASGCMSDKAAAPATAEPVAAAEPKKLTRMDVEYRAPGAATMLGFRTPPMKEIRLAFIGIGSRGSAAVRRVSKIPGCKITVLCDLREQAVKENKEWLKKNVPAQMPKNVYFGKDDSYKAACDDDNVDVVYLAVPAHLHAQMSLYAMRAGCHVLTEVPAANRLDDCWELVETCEKTKRHCMMLENTCYGKEELLAYNLCRKGVLGELGHAEGAYIHNLTERQLENSFRNRGKKSWKVAKNAGNTYPTHPLGPIAWYLDINRGDVMNKIISVSNHVTGWKDYIKETFKPGDWQYEMKLDRGDINTSIIKTAMGRTIMLQIDMATPRPYSRINLVQGSRGCFLGYGYPARLSIAKGKAATHVKDWLSQKEYDEYAEKYGHELWKTVGDIAKKVGGHGGIDFIMDLRWAYCLQNGLPLDMDVYDLAAWSSIVPCSIRSDLAGGMPIEIPDFTRGAWKTAKPRVIDGIDIVKMGLDDKQQIKKDKGQLEV